MPVSITTLYPYMESNWLLKQLMKNYAKYECQMLYVVLSILRNNDAQEHYNDI